MCLILYNNGGTISVGSIMVYAPGWSDYTEPWIKHRHVCFVPSSGFGRLCMIVLCVIRNYTLNIFLRALLVSAKVIDLQFMSH